MSGIDSNNLPGPGGVNPLDLIRKNRLNTPSDGQDLQGAAAGFESVLLNKLMDAMQKTIPDDGILSSGITKQVQSMFWMYLSQDLADKGGLGLGRQLQQQLREQLTGPEQPETSKIDIVE
ncbi:MAG: rod-binding protein [Phycisphaerae bacterium]